MKCFEGGNASSYVNPCILGIIGDWTQVFCLYDEFPQRPRAGEFGPFACPNDFLGGLLSSYLLEAEMIYVCLR